jgi:hypothetical protein
MLTRKTIVKGCAGVLMALATLTVAHADHGWIHWSGDVDDRAEVHIRADRVWIEHQNMTGVKNDHADIHGNLPLHRLHVVLDHPEGRGKIRLVQQPGRDNNFTAIIRIKDPQPGRGHYAFTLRWDDMDHMGHMGGDHR